MAKTNPAQALPAAHARIRTLEATVNRLTIERNVAQTEVEQMVKDIRVIGERRRINDAAHRELVLKAGELRNALAKSRIMSLTLGIALLVTIGSICL